MKKIGFIGLLSMAAFLLAFAFPVAAAGPASPVAPAAVVAMPAVPAVAAALPQEEDHPRIHEAIEAMRAARRHLENAAHDYHGHRVKAIEHLDRAIHEAEICEHEH